MRSTEMVELTINGERHAVDTPVGRSLAEVLRDDLGLTGTKIACFEGHCGGRGETTRRSPREEGKE